MNMSVSLLTVWSGIDETVVCFTNLAPMSSRLTIAAAPRDGTLIRSYFRWSATGFGPSTAGWRTTSQRR
jgi:hypothetical protein